MEEALSIRTATFVVCKYRLPTTGGWLPRVIQCIDDYLTGSLSHKAFTTACELGAAKSTLGYGFRRTAPIWKEAVQAAVRGGHMHVLRWMTGRDDGRGPWKADFNNVLEIAAAHGHLDVVKWLSKRGMDRDILLSPNVFTASSFEKTRYCIEDALSLAAEHGHFEVLKWIYGTQTYKFHGLWNPMGKAVANGHLAIAQWLHEVKGERCSDEAVSIAAKNGHLDVLQWLHSKNLFTSTRASMRWAAIEGRLEMVKWLHATHHETCSIDAMPMAASNGHLELVQWLYDNVHHMCHSSESRIRAENAAERGHLNVVKWLHEYFPNAFRVDAMDEAARNAHMDVITWLHEHRSEGCSKAGPINAAANGHLEVLKWLHRHYPETFEPGLHDLMDKAVGYSTRRLEVVQWLHENIPELRATAAMKHAATSGCLDIFLYLLENRTEGFSNKEEILYTQHFQVLCRFDSNTRGSRCLNPATSDQVEMLQTLFEQRPQFLQCCLTCLAGISCSRGNIEMLDWMNQFGIELRSTEPVRDAVKRGDVKLLQWFFDNGFETKDPELLALAARTTNLDIVRWLSEHGHAVNSLDLVRSAGWKYNTYESVPVLRWLVEHGPPLDVPTAKYLVLESRHVEIVPWVAEKDRKDLVLVALRKNDQNVLWWILARTKFQDEGVQQKIREVIQRGPEVARQWIDKNLREVEAFRWYFSTTIKSGNEEGEETELSSSKRKRCDSAVLRSNF